MSEQSTPPAPPAAEPSFACIRCWKLKKKCDKGAPQCKRCVAAGISCVYSSQPPTGRESIRAQENNNHHHGNGLLTPADEWPSKRSPLSLFNLGHAAPPSPESDVASENSPNNQVAGSRFVSAVFAPYHALKDELNEILRVFSLTANTWVPIVTEPQLLQLQKHAETSPDAETCILLLAIYLATKVPPEGSNLEPLYSIVKRVHTNIHTLSSQNILIIQSGMLLAYYEQGQSLHQASYMSMGAAVRLAQSAGFHRTIEINLENSGADRSMLEQQRHVWWCLVLLERVLALHTLDEVKPLAAPSPKLTDYLPSTWSSTNASDGAVELGSVVDSPNGAPTVHLPYTHPLGESVQAVFLMSKVLEHINQTRLTPAQRAQEVSTLDDMLHVYMLRALSDERRASGIWHQCCYAFFVCVASRFRLNIHNLKNTDSPESQESRQRSLIGIYIIARIGSQSKDTAQSMGNNDEFMKEINMPPWVLNAGRDSALVSLNMLKNPIDGVGDEEFWRHTLNFYRESFDTGGKKWKLGEECQNIVKKREEELSL